MNLMQADLSSIRLNLANAVMLARETVGWSQQRLADAADVCRATIADIEAGTADPRLSTILQISQALGVWPILLLINPQQYELLAELISPRTAVTGSSYPTKAGGTLAASQFGRMKGPQTHVAGLSSPSRRTAETVGTRVASSLGSSLDAKRDPSAWRLLSLPELPERVAC